MSLADHILAAVAKATPQAPMRDSEIYAAFRGKHRIETGECAAALETMTVQRLLNTARITRNGVTQDVYWPTGLKLPALTGVQPKELRIVPAASTPDTHGSRLIKVIVAHGPLIGAELADKLKVTGTPTSLFAKSAQDFLGGNVEEVADLDSSKARRAMKCALPSKK